MMIYEPGRISIQWGDLPTDTRRSDCGSTEEEALKDDDDDDDDDDRKDDAALVLLFDSCDENWPFAATALLLRLL